MKKCLISSFAIMLSLGIVFTPKPAKAMFPTLDITSIVETVMSNINLVNQYTKIKEAAKTVSTISNSIGSAVKSVSQLTQDKVAEAKEVKDRIERETNRVKEVKEKIQYRKEQLEEIKARTERGIEFSKEYKEKVFGIVSDVTDRKIGRAHV